MTRACKARLCLARLCVNGYPHVLATEPVLPTVAGTAGSFFPVPGTANMLPGR